MSIHYIKDIYYLNYISNIPQSRIIFNSILKVHYDYLTYELETRMMLFDKKINIKGKHVKVSLKSWLIP